jgi:biotin synthase
MANDILLGIKLNPDYISSAPFIPNAHTPLEHGTHGNINLALNTMAIFRIALKTPFIPSISALESLVKGGQRMGLEAGANVLTINFTPKESQRLYKIYTEQRFVVSLDHALRTVESAGLHVPEPIGAEDPSGTR